ncbi:MAG: DUF2232 domain-containing protein [Alphaproteobacteria bacterium]|jgi:hypothetical protein
MQKDALLAIAAGLASAVLHLSTQWSVIGALFFTLLAPLPLFMAGFGLGLTRALPGLVVAGIVVWGGADFNRFVLFLAADLLPVALVVRFALLNRQTGDSETDVQWYPPGLVLTWIALYGAGAFVLAMVITGSGPGGLQASVDQYVDGFQNLFAKASQNKPALVQMLDSIKRVFPFLVVTWWIVIVAANAAWGQKILVRLGQNRRPTPDFRTIELAPWLASGMVAATVAGLLGSGWLGFVATNVALILGIPYFLVGLAVIHAVSTKWKGRTAVLLSVYLMLFMFGWPALLIAGLGVMEPWAGVRARYGAPNHTDRA